MLGIFQFFGKLLSGNATEAASLLVFRSAVSSRNVLQFCTGLHAVRLREFHERNLIDVSTCTELTPIFRNRIHLDACSNRARNCSRIQSTAFARWRIRTGNRIKLFLRNRLVILVHKVTEMVKDAHVHAESLVRHKREAHAVFHITNGCATRIVCRTCTRCRIFRIRIDDLRIGCAARIRTTRSCSNLFDIFCNPSTLVI